jgi:predicted cupin superfamily sugar epimerase
MPDRPPLAEALDLQPHPEGGWYRRTWASPETVTLPDGRVRPTATLILFLLPAGESSAWHRVRSSEVWLAHTGTVRLQHGGSADAPDEGGPVDVAGLRLRRLRARRSPRVARAARALLTVR